MSAQPPQPRTNHDTGSGVSGRTNPITVLCIDDEEPGLLVRKVLLETAGYRVLTAGSGEEGIRVFEEHSPDAVVLDYWMSGVNGVATAKRLTAISPNVPIIMLSAYGTLLDETIGLAEVWIRKGEEDPAFLLSKLEELIAARESQ